jgi:hypothetical protein
VVLFPKLLKYFKSIKNEIKKTRLEIELNEKMDINLIEASNLLHSS